MCTRKSIGMSSLFISSICGGFPCVIMFPLLYFRIARGCSWSVSTFFITHIQIMRIKFLLLSMVKHNYSELYLLSSFPPFLLPFNLILDPLPLSIPSVYLHSLSTTVQCCRASVALKCSTISVESLSTWQWKRTVSGRHAWDQAKTTCWTSS